MVFGVSMDASFHGGSNDTIGDLVRHRRPELRCFLTAAALLACTCIIILDCTHWPLHLGGRGVIRSGRHLTAAALSSCSDVIRIVFSLLMSPSLVCWIGPTAVRKKVARVPLGRGLKSKEAFLQCVRNGVRGVKSHSPFDKYAESLRIKTQYSTVYMRTA